MRNTARHGLTIALRTQPTGIAHFSFALVDKYWEKQDFSLKRMLFIFFTHLLNLDLEEACLTHLRSDITSKQKLKERAF